MVKKTAEEFAKEQKEISISEFFEKNKHLLGFDNPTKALLMTVKEAVDNSLDACEEAGILPNVTVKIKSMADDKYRVSVHDNGPGIVKEQIPRIFGKLLYGSKFHRLRQSRGQQGIGISAVVLYSQLTTGAHTRIWAKTGKDKKTHYYELLIDTMKNEPKIVKDETNEVLQETGVKVEIDVIGRYRKTIEDYLKQTSVANPFAKIAFSAPDGTKITFPRSVDSLPKEPKEMKPHPYGMEFGTLFRLLEASRTKTLVAFLTNDFSSVGNTTAKELCKEAKLNPGAGPSSLERNDIEKLLKAMQKVKIQRPPLDCLSPIGDKELEKSLKKEYPESEIIIAVSREPEVYRGFPFMIEVGIVYGQKNDEGKKENAVDLVRFANRVPLIYQQGACATVEAVKETDWKRYGLQQSGENIPSGPAKIIIHMCSVWVPFVSESKEAIAPYPDIVKEMKLALQDAGRQLSRYLSGKRKTGEQKRRLLIFERYSEAVAEALAKLTDKDKKDIEKNLKIMVKERVNMPDDEEGAEEVKVPVKKEKQKTLVDKEEK